MVPCSVGFDESGRAKLTKETTSNIYALWTEDGSAEREALLDQSLERIADLLYAAEASIAAGADAEMS